jgi:hypothetical protein
LTVELIRRLDRGFTGQYTLVVAAEETRTGNPYTVKFHTNSTRFERELAILTFFNNTKFTTIPNVFAHDPRAQLFIQSGGMSFHCPEFHGGVSPKLKSGMYLVR